MNEIIKKELTRLVGKKVLIFLINNFRYEGKVLAVDDFFLKLFDVKSQNDRIISLSKIAEIEVQKNGK